MKTLNINNIKVEFKKEYAIKQNVDLTMNSASGLLLMRTGTAKAIREYSEKLNEKEEKEYWKILNEFTNPTTTKYIETFDVKDWEPRQAQLSSFKRILENNGPYNPGDVVLDKEWSKTQSKHVLHVVGSTYYVKENDELAMKKATEESLTKALTNAFELVEKEKYSTVSVPVLYTRGDYGLNPEVSLRAIINAIKNTKLTKLEKVIICFESEGPRETFDSLSHEDSTEPIQEFAVIWDQTGVLFKNGRTYVQKTFEKVFQKHGINIPKECFNEKYRGNSLKTQMEMWEKDFNVKFPLTVDEFSKESVKLGTELLEQNKENERDENLINLLEELKAKNVPMAITTSSTKDRAKNILKILEQDKYIDVLVGVEDVKNHEPAIDALELTSKKLGVPLFKCVVIEDGVSGLKAAKKAGCKTIGFAAHGEEQEQAITNENPDLIIKDFSELSYSKIESLFN